jgi:hypothetical protein
MLVATVLVVIGCGGTLEEITPGAGDDDDTGADATVGDQPDAAGTEDCEPPVATAKDGHHNPGLTCNTPGCHKVGATGAAAPPYTIGGTLYNDLEGTEPVGGATIIVLDAAGTEYKLVTSTNGNFWSIEPMTFPVTVSASRCPDTLPMVSPVTEAGGSCNQVSCHAGPMRVYLP